MNRRLLTILLPIASASLIAGCTSIADDDAIARVGDVELTEATLADFRTLVGGPEPDPEDLTTTRAAISSWSQVEVLAQLGLESGEPTPPDVAEASLLQAESAPGYADLQTSTQELIVDYFNAIAALPNLSPPEEELEQFFDRGPEASGFACVSHILVATQEEADEVTAELEGGADFATLAGERSTDPGSSVNGGFLACTSAAEISAQFVPEFAAAAVTAVPGVPTAPVQSEFGFHIVRNGTFSEHPEELAPVIASGAFAAQIALADADVYVNPRYGSFDSQTGEVVPLG